MVRASGDRPAQPRLTRGDFIWGGIIAAGTAFEVWALKRELEHTLTRRTRHHFRTHHPVGKIVFAAAWTWLYAWYLRHIVKG